MAPRIVVGSRGAERVRRGHPWIYRSDVADVRAAGGDVVEVRTENGRRLGDALYSDRSQITLRMLTSGDRPADGALLRERIDAAIALRERLAIDSTAYRLVHAEGDLLPSLIVDRYADVLVVQSLSQGMDKLQDEIVSILHERLRPAAILARNDANSRALEGLEKKIEVLRGEIPDTLVVRDRAIDVQVDVRGGQKTGLFLDQRENHWAAESYARGRLLDGFSYQGGFALRLARRSTEVIAVDVSEDAALRTLLNAERNGLTNVRAQTANAFDFLRAAERGRERFDTIVLDPPAFAKNRAALPKALAGYKEINLRALKMLNPGGILVTCSCSHHVSEEQFLQVVGAAAVDARAVVSLVEKRTQARDHPILLHVPETAYLKCLILRKLEG